MPPALAAQAPVLSTTHVQTQQNACRHKGTPACRHNGGKRQAGKWQPPEQSLSEEVSAVAAQVQHVYFLYEMQE
jgi:hypothetical protein